MKEGSCVHIIFSCLLTNNRQPLDFIDRSKNLFPIANSLRKDSPIGAIVFDFFFPLQFSPFFSFSLSRSLFSSQILLSRGGGFFAGRDSA